MFFRVRRRSGHGLYHAGEVGGLSFDGQGICGQGVFLNLIYVGLYAVGERQDKGYADDAYAAGEGREQGAGLLGLEVVKGEGQGGGEGHAGLFLAFVLTGRLHALGVERVAVAHYLAVEQLHYARGIALRKVGVVRDHDHQLVGGYLLEQFHYLHAGLAVKRAGGLVGKQYVGVVYKRAGYGHTLHLAAGHLVRLLVYLVAETHALEDLYCTFPALFAVNAGDGQRKLDVCQYALVRDEVIGLKDETDCVVAVGVPVAVLVLLGGAPVYDQITVSVLVKAADDVQKRSFTAARGPEYGHKFALAEADAHAAQRVDSHVAGNVVLAYIF